MTPIALQPEIVLALAAAFVAGLLAGIALHAWLAARRRRRRDRALDALMPAPRPTPRPAPPPAPRSHDAAPAPAPRFSLAQAPDRAPTRPMSSALPTPERPTAVGRGRTILLADDRFELRAVNAAYLTGHGYHVLEADDGDEALEVARRERPDAIVLDHSMPRRTGIEVVRELKSDPATARIPVVFMTAHSYGAVGRTAMEAGCASYLPKPCDPSRVLQEVARFTVAPTRG